MGGKRQDDCTDISIQLVLFCWNINHDIVNIYLIPSRKWISQLVDIISMSMIQIMFRPQTVCFWPTCLRLLTISIFYLLLSAQNQLHVTALALILYTLNEYTNWITHYPKNCSTQMLEFTFIWRELWLKWLYSQILNNPLQFVYGDICYIRLVYRYPMIDIPYHAKPCVHV